MGPSAPFFCSLHPMGCKPRAKKREKKKKVRRAATLRASIALFFSRRKVQARFYKRPKPLAIRTGRETVPQRQHLLISDEHGQECAGRGTRELATLKRMAQEAPRQNQRTAGHLRPAKLLRVFARGPQWTDAPTSGLRPDTPIDSHRAGSGRLSVSTYAFKRLHSASHAAGTLHFHL